MVSILTIIFCARATANLTTPNIYTHEQHSEPWTVASPHRTQVHPRVLPHTALPGRLRSSQTGDAEKICKNCTSADSCNALASNGSKCEWNPPPTPPTPAPPIGNCTGANTGLDRAQCAAYPAIFNETGGTGWSDCSDIRLDPCSHAVV
jgi:hypothetical protein